jgi:tetratricopeptide (TPR) repeat protein
LNQDSEALEAFNKALELNESLPEAYISKAGVLEVMSRYREALWCCQQALDCISDDKSYLYPSLFDQQILLLIRLKRFRHAEQVLLECSDKLSDKDYDYLSASYRGLIDHLIKNRRSLRRQTASPRLSVVRNASL